MVQPAGEKVIGASRERLKSRQGGSEQGNILLAAVYSVKCSVAAFKAWSSAL